MKNISIENIRQKYQALLPYLHEKARRIWAATEVVAYGRGGIAAVCAATGLSNKTVDQGLKDLKNNLLDDGRIRKKGAGRKKITSQQKGLLSTLEFLIEPSTRGDPENTLKWLCKSLRNIAKDLQIKGFKISYRTVGSELKKLGFSLQANKKTKEGKYHKDRDAQFHYINDSVIAMHRKGQPTISVDTKKKENIGEFKNSGQELCPKGKPIEVNGHDFPDKKLGKAIPYGIYDIGRNKGWVSVGISADTAEFSVNAIRSWWYWMGKKEYKQAKELLITADCGGSNSAKGKLWKKELQKFSNETDLEIHVRHFPPGTSKWNKIEHRMFSYISKNWRGKPLINRETVVNLIGNTRTEKGLKIRAMLDENVYELGKKVSKKEMESISLEPDAFHPDWNYVIRPQIPIVIV